jgi:sugar O-acyltransferase (sialic acid O-acetyltransferase NeuD family)
MKKLVLFGVRSPLVAEYEETCRRAAIEIAAAVSVDGAPRLIATDLVVELAELVSTHRSIPCLVCAFSPQRRRELVSTAIANGFRISDALIDPTSIVASSTALGVGTYVNAGCVIGSIARIGQNVFINRSSSIGHHAIFEDFVTIGPGVTIAGNVRIGTGSIIGAGSTVLPNLRIGSGSIIAAGSVVRRDVADGTFVAGNPAIEKPFNLALSSINSPGEE